MQISTISGITDRRTLDNIDFDSYTIDLSKTAKSAIVTPKTNSQIKTTKVSSAQYARLDSTMPAVAFVKLSSLGFITDAIPPKYIKNFSCTRVNNTVGSFEMTLMCPINTFEPQTEDLNLKLINLFGHINSKEAPVDTLKSAKGEAVSSVFPCTLTYGWRGGSGKTYVKYDNAGIYGMTLDYSGNYYTYTIKGYVNSISAKANASGVKILSVDELSKIDTTDLSDTAKTAIDSAGSSNVSELDLSKKSYTLTVAKGATIYKRDSNGKIKSSNKKTSSEITFTYSSNQNNTATWTDDYLYVYNAPKGKATVNAYYVSDVTFTEITSSKKKKKKKKDSVQAEPTGLNLSVVEENEQISTKIEILANYLFGETYEIEVAHVDKVFDKQQTIAALVSSVESTDTAEDDKESSTLNETTTSWYTWLVHMVRACLDYSQSDAYTTYSYLDIDGDGIITQLDIDAAKKVDTQSIKDKWSKHGIDDSVTVTWRNRQNKAYDKTGDYAWDYIRAMTEDEFNNNYHAYVNPDVLPPLNYVLVDPYVISPPNGSLLGAVITRTYDDYLADYSTYQIALKLETTNLSEVNQLLDTYDGGIKKGATAQYNIYFMDAAAGKKSKIYIGPNIENDSGYQYVVGNNAKDSTVLSFSISEDLVYLVSAAKSYIETEGQQLYKVDPDTGATVKTKIDTSASQIASNEEYAHMVANSILSKVAAGHIKAKLEVLADVTSRALQVTDPVTIKCKSNGGKNMLSGRYMVSAVTDSLTESGQLKTSIDLQFTQSTAFNALKDVILTHLSTATEAEDK